DRKPGGNSHAADDSQPAHHAGARCPGRLAIGYSFAEQAARSSTCGLVLTHSARSKTHDLWTLPDASSQDHPPGLAEPHREQAAARGLGGRDGIRGDTYVHGEWISTRDARQ